MIKQQFKQRNLLIAGIVAFVIAIGMISVYGYTQYGPKQITISSLEASTGKMDAKTVTASNADTVEKVLRDNQIPIDSIHYICSENLNSKVKDVSQIHIEKKTTSQSNSTIENDANQASGMTNTSNSNNIASVANVSSSNSVSDGISKTPSSTAVQPVSVVVPVSKPKDTNVSSELPTDTVKTMSDNIPHDDNNLPQEEFQKEQAKPETIDIQPVVSAMSDTSQNESEKKTVDNTTDVSINANVDNSKSSATTGEAENVNNLSDNNVDDSKVSSNEIKDEVKSDDTETNAEQSIKTEIIEMDIPYGTKRVNSDQVKKGEEVVTTLGVNGLKNVTCEVTYVKDKIVSRKTISEEIITEPITEVISVGTGTETTLQPSTTNSTPNQEKVDETPGDSQIQPPENILDYLSEYALSVNMSNGGSYGNATQSTSSINMDFVRAVVAQEGGTSYEGALAVISCIMNRSDSGAWGETAVESIIKTPGQFEAYESGAYEKYLGQSLPEVEAAIRDCMDCGLRTHPYESFRGYQTDESVTNIGGNWYF